MCLYNRKCIYPSECNVILLKRKTPLNIKLKLIGASVHYVKYVKNERISLQLVRKYGKALFGVSWYVRCKSR